MLPLSRFPGSKFIYNYLAGMGVGENIGDCGEWRVYIFQSDQEWLGN